MTAYICIAPEKVLSNSVRYGRDEVDWEAIHRLLLMGLDSFMIEHLQLYLSDTYLKLPNIQFVALSRKIVYNESSRSMYSKHSVDNYTATLMESLLMGSFTVNDLCIIDKAEKAKYEYPYVIDLNLRTVKMLFYEAFFKLGVNTLSDATLTINNQPQPYTIPDGNGVTNLIDKFVNCTEMRLEYLILTRAP